MTGDTDQSVARQGTLPRHLHRFVLRLLRPAEASMRRLIIIAARGIVVTLPKVYDRKARPRKPPLNRSNGYGTNIVIRRGPLPEWAKALMPKRSPRLSLPLLDPMKRFGVRRKYVKPSAMPQIRVLGAMAGRHRSSASRSRCLRLFRRRMIRWMREVSTGGWTCSAARSTICRSRRCAWRAGRHAGMRGWRRREANCSI
jgi:hypothetical protein